MKKIVSIGFFIGLFLIGLMMFLKVGKIHQKNEAKKSMLFGDQIINALEQYKQQMGEYPTELIMLEPNYIRKIPQPTYGKKEWEYSGKRDSFTLMVEGDNFTFESYMFTSKNKFWEIFDEKF